MELKALHPYSNMYFTLEKGDSTEGRTDITPEMKTYLIETFPDWFELVPTSFDLVVPEDKLNLITKVQDCQAEIDNSAKSQFEPEVKLKSEPKVTTKVAPKAVKAKGKK